MASTSASTFIDFVRENAQLIAGRDASVLGLSSRTMTDAVCHSGSAILTHSADGLDDVPRLAWTKGLRSLAVRDQRLDLVPRVQCQDRSLEAPIASLTNYLVDQTNWLVSYLVAHLPYLAGSLKAAGAARMA